MYFPLFFFFFLQYWYIVAVWQKNSLFLFAFISKALQELSAFMVVNGHPIKNRQKLLRNLRVSRAGFVIHNHMQLRFMNASDFYIKIYKDRLVFFFRCETLKDEYMQ